MRIDLYNRVRSQSASGQHVHALLIPNFDATAIHNWTFARVFDTAQSSAYAIRLYVDNKPVFNVQDENVIKSGEYQTLSILNNTPAKVTVTSTLQSNIAFEEENAVLDVMQYGADANFLNAKGKILNAGDYALNIGNMANILSQTGGIKFRVLALGGQTSGNLFALKMGATALNFSLNGGNLAVTASDLAHHDYNFTVSNTLDIYKNYKPEIFHEFKVVRVKALNTNAYAVRVYVDSDLACELYFAGAMDNSDSNISISNISNAQVAIKALLYSRPLAQTARVYDLIELNGSVDYLNGVTLNNNDIALNVSGDIVQGSYGIAFDFKAESNFNGAGEIIAVTMGASKMFVKVCDNGNIAISVNALVGDTAIFERLVEIPNSSDHTQWRSIEFIKSRFIHPSGKLNSDGYQISIKVNGEVIADIIEVYAPSFTNEFNFVKIQNVCQNAVMIKSSYSQEKYQTLLANVKEEQKVALQNLLSNFVEENYTATNWQALNNLYSAKLSEIDNAQSIYQIEAVILSATAEMNGVESISATALKEIKSNAKTQIGAYARQSDYTAEGWASIVKYVERANIAINNANSEEEVQKALTAGKNAIDVVWTIAELKEAGFITEEENSVVNVNSTNSENGTFSNREVKPLSKSSQTASNGCASSLLAGNSLVILLAVGLLSIFKKRN